MKGENIIGLLIVFFIFFCVIKWELYKYNDCKKVGHTTMYCLFSRN